MTLEVIAGAIIIQLVIGAFMAIINAKVLGVHLDYLKERVNKHSDRLDDHSRRIGILEVFKK